MGDILQLAKQALALSDKASTDKFDEYSFISRSRDDALFISFARNALPTLAREVIAMDDEAISKEMDRLEEENAALRRIAKAAASLFSDGKLKTTKITMWNSRLEISIVDAGQDVDIKCAVANEPADLTLKGPHINLMIEGYPNVHCGACREMSRTLWVILGAVVGLLGYDLWTIVTNGYNSTISWTLYTFSQSYPVVPFLLGITFGHLFWPVGIKPKPTLPDKS